MMRKKNIYSKEFVNKFNEFKKAFNKASDVFDELYVMGRSHIKVFDEIVMISSHLDDAARWFSDAEEKINKEVNNG